MKKTAYRNNEGTFSSFFTGPIYPIVIAIIMIAAYHTSEEVTLNVLNLGLASLGLLTTRSIKPLIPVFICYLYQFSPETGIDTLEGLGWLLSGWRLALYIISFGPFTLAIISNTRRNGALGSEELRAIPYPLAALILSVAFLLNGVLGGEWLPASLGYGFAQILTFFVFFYLFYLGLKNEDGRALASYLAYCSAICAVVISVNMVSYIITDDSFLVDGTFLRHQFKIGFGNVNTVGQNLAVLIPMIFYGAMKNRAPLLYFGTSLLCVAGIAVTLSRNAWIIGGVVFVLCFIIAAFVGERKRLFRVLLPLFVLACLAAVLLYGDVLYELFKVNFIRGFDDNGRFELWNYGIEEFLTAPIFGKGFYALDLFEPYGFPLMVHNTVIELLAAMGVFGLLAYGCYRIATIKPFLKHPTLAKSMLGLSILIVLVGSLLDNFIFYIPHMLYYPIALAVAFRIYNEETEVEKMFGYGWY